MKVWILIFSAALFAGGTCLGVGAPAQDRAAAAAPDQGRRAALQRQSPQPRFLRQPLPRGAQLSDDQDLRFDEILSESQEEMQALGRAMRAVQDKTRDRIVGILSPSRRRSSTA
jgi:hypothetical protein